jgi:NDP-sugar pyrophosphorylase family protein
MLPIAGKPILEHIINRAKAEGFSHFILAIYHLGHMIEDYFGTEEESHSTKDTCPMCDSDTDLTEVGLKEKQERDEREARWAAEETENENE